MFEQVDTIGIAVITTVHLLSNLHSENQRTRMKLIFRLYKTKRTLMSRI